MKTHVAASVKGSPVSEADTDRKRVLNALKKLDPKAVEKMSAVETRKQPCPADAVKALLKQQGRSEALEPGVTTKNMTYPAAEGTQALQVYTPDGSTGPLPIVVYYHGGGFAIEDIGTYDATPRAISKRASVVVVSVEY